MKATVKKWGNSAALRIPASVMQSAHLALDAEVDVREEDGRIIIEKLSPPAYDLQTLLNGITTKNLHGAIETSPPVGKEIW